MIDINHSPEYLEARVQAFRDTLAKVRSFNGEPPMFYQYETEAFAIGYDAGFRAKENFNKNTEYD